MSDLALRALAALRLDWAPVREDVWNPNPHHVDGLHVDAVRETLAGLEDARASQTRSPLGVVIQGPRGAGKTHLLGWLREQVQERDGYFFLVSPHSGAAFWESVVAALLDGLIRRVKHRPAQLWTLLTGLATATGTPDEVRAALLGDTPLTPSALNTFVVALRRLDPQVGRDCQETVRALVLYGSGDPYLEDLGQDHLYSTDYTEPAERALWGLRRGRPPHRVVQDLSWLLALTGPSVIAVDQIDEIIAISAKSTQATAHAEEDMAAALALDQIAEGLMALRELTRRTLSVISCLPASWEVLRSQAVDTVPDRFRELPVLQRIGSQTLGQALVERRLSTHYQQYGFEPPYGTWPVHPSAFQDALELTPRVLLQQVDKHIRSCVQWGAAQELTSLDPDQADDRTPTPTRVPAGVLEALDTKFARLLDHPPVALDPSTEDATVPGLLSAGLRAWILEQDEGEREFVLDPPPGAKPALHARLRRTLDEATEEESHWAFRAIDAPHPIAALSRLRAAAAAAGLGLGGDRRHLVVLRNTVWSGGAKTRRAVQELERLGGRTLTWSAEDVRVLAAMRDLLAAHPEHLRPWLVSRRPSQRVSFLREALADALPAQPAPPSPPDSSSSVPGDTAPGPDDAGPNLPGPSGPGHTGPGSGGAPHQPGAHSDGALAVVGGGSTGGGVPTVSLGVGIDHPTPVTVALEALRKHTAIFAGSGSGKTVLIRRLIEECALHGVSAIVLDPNNDLARLGDPWPQPPAGWGPDDPARAEEYLAGTDVVVWTPRREAGRPLSFQPLPDFVSVRDDPDEFAAAVDAAVAALAPRAKVNGTTSKASHGQAVLTEAIRYFGRTVGVPDLKAFVQLLGALPDGVSTLDKADQIAAELAQNLIAAMVTDPLFGGGGTPVDPATLLTPAPGRRARISVISLIGLSNDDQRQSFVQQLQMALFAWIKRNPAGDRPLGGLFVMDEAQTFAPSGAMTACTQSTLALASQARKYGLGLVFATQAPKGLHNQIPGNATTQLFGLLNSPTQIEAAREMARAKSGDIPDVGRLRAGQFYAAVEGTAFTKVQTPLCLSHHPKSPLTPEEVLVRANPDRANPDRRNGSPRSGDGGEPDSGGGPVSGGQVSWA